MIGGILNICQQRWEDHWPRPGSVQFELWLFWYSRCFAEPSYFWKWRHRRDCSNARPLPCGITHCLFETIPLDLQNRFCCTLSHRPRKNTFERCHNPMNNSQSHCSNSLQATVAHSIAQYPKGQGVQHICWQKQLLDCYIGPALLENRSFKKNQKQNISQLFLLYKNISKGILLYLEARKSMVDRLKSMFSCDSGHSIDPSLVPLCSSPFCEPGAAWRSIITLMSWLLEHGFQEVN